MPTKAELEARIVDLETDNALLKKVYETERDRTNEWCEEIKRTKETNKILISIVQEDPVTSNKWKQIQYNKAMFEWFLKYLKNGKTNTEACDLIYPRAIKKVFIEEIDSKHKPMTDGKYEKTVRRKISRHLQSHCKRYKIPFPE